METASPLAPRREGTANARALEHARGVRRVTDIRIGQCEAAGRITQRLCAEPDFDYIVVERLASFAWTAPKRPEFAQALPGFVLTLRRMFVPEETRENFARFDRLPRDMEEAAEEEPEPSIEDPKVIAERARQPGFLKELPSAPALWTS